jgi:hypothetical protein
LESIVGVAPIRVKLGKVEGTRIDTGATPDSVSFDVDVSMDEESRTNGELTLTFNLTIRTKPTLVKFEVGGTAVISGGREAFDAALEMDEESSVPKVLHFIYQRVFTSLYLIAAQLEVPYPPPDLLHAPSETRDIGVEVPPEEQVAPQQNA